MKPLSPTEVMAKIAEALPADCKENVIIIGSLAAGYPTTLLLIPCTALILRASSCVE